MAIPDVLKSTGLISTNRIKKVWNCAKFDAEGSSMLGPHYICALTDRSIILFDSGKLFGKEKTHIINKATINAFAFYQPDDHKPYCIINHDSLNASLSLNKADFLKYFLEWKSDIYDSGISCKINFMTNDKGEENFDEKYIRFFLTKTHLKGIVYEEEKDSKPISLPITTIEEINAKDDINADISGPFTNKSGKVVTEFIDVDFGNKPDRDKFVFTINKAVSKANEDAGIKTVGNKKQTFRDTARVIGKINNSSINKDCVIDLSDGLTIIDLKTGNLVGKIELNQIESTEIITNSLCLRFQSSFLVIQLKRSLDSISDETKFWLSRNLAKTRIESPIIGHTTIEKNDVITPLVIKENNSVLVAEGDFKNISLDKKIFSGAYYDDEGLLKIDLPDKSGSLIFNEHSFVFAYKKIHLASLSKRLGKWEVTQLRFRWTELLSSYLLYYLFNDTHLLLKYLNSYSEDIEKALLLKNGINDIKAQLNSLEHVFIPHIELAGKQWGAEIGFKNKSLIDNRSTNLLKTLISRITMGTSRILNEVERELRYIDRNIVEIIFDQNDDDDTDWLGMGLDVGLAIANPLMGAMRGVSRFTNMYQSSNKATARDKKDEQYLKHSIHSASEVLSRAFDTSVPSLMAQTNLFIFEWVKGIFNNESRLLSDNQDRDELIKQSYILRINRILTWGMVPTTIGKSRSDEIEELLIIPTIANNDIYTSI
jgi:hypothetical protein